jgi:diadenylate cyclase
MNLDLAVRWQDVVDVLVLTFVLYRLYLFLRGTVAVQVLFGMLVLVAAAFAADQVGLMLTSYVLRGVGAVATIAIVVVFRDEIRRGLGRVNPIRWWRARRGLAAGARSPTFARTIADAAFVLGSQRVGALVVLPGTDALDEHLTGGVDIDGVPSTELFEAIFHTASPIHDGAVVMRAGRVRRAGCFLPVTARGDLPDHLGSRHRAALGLSEKVDAAVVVVSEERGEVSLVTGGLISSVASAEALATRIVELRGSPAAAPVSVRGPAGRHRVRDTIALVVVAALVIGAWWVVVGEPGTVVTRTVSVELRNVPEDLEASPPRPDRVAVHVRGPRTRLDTLGATDVQAWVDLGGAAAGRARHRLEASAPAGIEITEIVPAEVVVRLRPSE